MGIYIVAKLGTDWPIFADARVLTKSNMAELIRDLIITYILTNFGADWSIFVDDRV